MDRYFVKIGGEEDGFKLNTPYKYKQPHPNDEELISLEYGNDRGECDYVSLSDYIEVFPISMYGTEPVFHNDESINNILDKVDFIKQTIVNNLQSKKIVRCIDSLRSGPYKYKKDGIYSIEESIFEELNFEEQEDYSMTAEFNDHIFIEVFVSSNSLKNRFFEKTSPHRKEYLKRNIYTNPKHSPKHCLGIDKLMYMIAECHE